MFRVEDGDRFGRNYLHHMPGPSGDEGRRHDERDDARDDARDETPGSHGKEDGR